MGLFSWSVLLLMLVVLHGLVGLNLGYDQLETNGFSSKSDFVSAVGDPGMRSPNVRVGFEAWNFCNEVGFEAPNVGSPRLADCADLYCNSFLRGILFWV